MEEQIGKVTLDYTFYPGEDLYCDGAVEDELLQIVSEHDPSEFQRIIEEKKSWPVLYHLSHLRGNIVEWVPLPQNAKVLEVGSGCGAITSTLTHKAGQLTCIDLSKKRSLINANRNKDRDNITIHVGNFKDVEPTLDADYDAIFLIGVLEYGQLYIDTETPYVDFMKILKKHVKPDGQIVVAIENKFGLKYWAGCREDHVGTFFTGIEDYHGQKGIRTFTRKGLEDILTGAGIRDYTFYYPYPDYKFMTSMYSDAYLPKQGELSDNLRNFDRSRLQLFDEKEAFDGILREGLFSLYSNSYLVLIGAQPDTKYVKYSNDRSAQYCIRTDICQDKEGGYSVYKYPVAKQAESHIASIQDSYELLSKRYEGSGLKMNLCKPVPGGVQFEYVTGETLEEKLDRCLDLGDTDGFESLIKQYLERISFGQEHAVTDLDLIFANIIVSEENWTVIDYEWTKRQSFTKEEVAFRAFYCYLIGAARRRKIAFELMEKYLGISEAGLGPWLEKEVSFQKSVTGQHQSMTEIRNGIGNEIYTVDGLMGEQKRKADLRRVQVYEDDGTGFSEDRSYFLREAEVLSELEGDSYQISFSVMVSDQVKQLRIDPAFTSCMVEELVVQIAGVPLDVASENGKEIKLNGDLILDKTCLFETIDPSIVLSIDKACEVQVSMRITLMPPRAMTVMRKLLQTKEKNKGFRGLFK